MSAIRVSQRSSWRELTSQWRQRPRTGNGQVCTQAPETERERLLVALLAAAGLLSLVAVANGVFARIRLDEHWPSLRRLHDELARVQPTDVSALVKRLQFTRSDALDGLMQWAGTALVLASSAEASVLVALLMHRKRQRIASDAEG